MLPKTHRACFSFLALILLASSAEAQFKDHNPPYQDPHFDLRHRPQYDYGTRPTSGDYYAHRATSNSYEGHYSTCGVCNGNCGGNETSNGCAIGTRGSRGPTCPPVDNANLQLYVEDGLQVEINGQRTKQQALAGVHRNSRIFLLDGLDPNQLSPTDIVVFDCDQTGVPTQYHLTLWVRAGERYKVRYPHGFELIPESHPAPVEWTPPGEPMLESHATPAEELIPPTKVDGPPATEHHEIVPLGILPIGTE